MERLRSKLTYSNVVATVALSIALAGGTAFAATQMLPKNSVGTKQLKSNAVTTAKIKNGSVTGAKIDASTLATVPSATSATKATTADSATTAKTAGTATDAGHADTASRAETAGHADTAGNSESLAGVPASGYEGKAMWALLNESGTAIIAQSGGISIEAHFTGETYFHFPAPVVGKAISVTPSYNNAGDQTVAVAAPCGGEFGELEATKCYAGTNTSSDAYVETAEAGTLTNAGFYITVLP